MGDGCLRVVGDRLTGRDVQDPRRPGPGVALVASDVLRVDVGHGPVALEVGRRADVLPVCRVGDAGEGVF